MHSSALQPWQVYIRMQENTNILVPNDLCTGSWGEGCEGRTCLSMYAPTYGPASTCAKLSKRPKRATSAKESG